MAQEEEKKESYRTIYDNCHNTILNDFVVTNKQQL